jgi:ribosome-binding factor A
MMEESTRQKKVARIIQQDLAIYFQRNAGLFAKGGMLTVTQVRISPDLGLAKVFLSIFAVPDKEATLKAVKTHTKEVRKYLGRTGAPPVAHSAGTDLPSGRFTGSY